MLLKGNFIHYVEQTDMFTHIRTAKRWSALRKHPSKYTTLYKRRFNVSWMNVESKMLQPCMPAGACRLSLFVDGFRRIFTFSEKVTLIKIVLLPFCVPSSLNIFHLCIIRLPYWLRPLWKWSILKRNYLLPFREQILSFIGHVRPAKIQIILRIRAVWSEFSLVHFGLPKKQSVSRRTMKTLIRLRWLAAALSLRLAHISEGTIIHVEAPLYKDAPNSLYNAINNIE